MTLVHSPIGASSYYRWKACPASVKLSEGVPSQESQYAKAGTIAHDLAAQILEAHFFNKDKPNIPPGYPQDEWDAIQLYVATIKKDILSHGCQQSTDTLLIEHKFDLSSVHPGLFGTADCVALGDDGLLLVYDYKHGAGIPVDVEGNLQLMYYGLGALLSMNAGVSEVELVVVQPRCTHAKGTVRRYRFNSIELLDFAGQLKKDVEETKKPNPRVNPGEHCRFCPAAAYKCEAVRQRSLAVAKKEFSAVQDYDSNKLKEALDALPMIEAWIKNVREFAYQEASHGRPPSGYKLVEKRAVRKWRNEDEAKLVLDQLMFEDDYLDKKLKSVAKIEKQISKDEMKSVEHLVLKESSGLTLVQDKDKRSAVSAGAKNDFKQIT